MMRYQRVSPDCLPLSNGRKPSLRAYKEDYADSNGIIPNYPPSFDGKAPRARSAFGSLNATTTSDNPFPYFSENQPDAARKTQSHHDSDDVCSGGRSVLLQWGHNKKTRGSRAESRATADESAGHSRQVIKIQRRAAAVAGAEKLAAIAAMPPPGASYTRGANQRPCTPVRDATAPISRSVDERSGGQSRPEKRSSPSPLENSSHKTTASLSNGGCAADTAMNPEPRVSDQNTCGATAEKLNLDQFEWPRIYVSLSRKEKEDDFLVMKGTKLPQRPKKRPKNIDKTLQYCFPGMWLSDLTRGRYEVREKKCVKKKRRGLKGMESMDSDSE